MIIQSLVSVDGRLKPVEVEIALAPGLPQMHFLGLADQGIKESILRIKSAIRQQGFEYPKAQQIIVNLRPNHFRKSSRGLELAVATGILLKTKQIEVPLALKELTVYGELSLSGEVHEPEDLDQFVPLQSESLCLTGPGGSHDLLHKYTIQSLRNLQQPQYQAKKESENFWKRPEMNMEFLWSSPQARLLQLMAVGRHHTLMAGPSGLGKTTLAQSIKSLLPEPNLSWMTEYLRYFPKRDWWPEVSPHHTISHQGLLGGGAPIRPGELSRAHGGILILDELLEFDPLAVEALREPMQEGAISLVKRQNRARFPAQVQFVATTNLCPCGQWIPQNPRDCYFSQQKCLSTLRKLSGPFLDRFQILHFVKKEDPQVTGAQIFEKVMGVFEFQKTQFRPKWNAMLSEKEILLPENLFRVHGLEELTPRRRIATLRVARSLADLDFSDEIRSPHLEEARSEWSVVPFQKLKQG